MRGTLNMQTALGSVWGMSQCQRTDGPPHWTKHTHGQLWSQPGHWPPPQPQSPWNVSWPQYSHGPLVLPPAAGGMVPPVPPAAPPIHVVILP